MSKKSTSPVHSSPLHREVPAVDVGSEKPSETNTNATLNRSSSSSVAPTPSGGSAGSTPTGTKGHFSMPPPSQPLLAGGTGSNDMTAIQEERELG